MTILIFLIISYILLSISLMKVFEKAGKDPKKALIPGVNFATMCELVGRKKIYALWLLFPIVNIFIFTGLCVDLARSFGRLDLKDSALAVIYAPAIFYSIGKNKEDKYYGPVLEQERQYFASIEAARAANNEREVRKLEHKNPYTKSQPREWVEAIVFAVFAAAFIRMFLIEAYTIPTTSMEGSLLAGDFLFVSKAHYGMRTPKTVAMVPLLHNVLPVIGSESYLENPSLPFYRLPAIEKIDAMDPVVFNYPEGDSIYMYPGRTYSIYDIRRNGGDVKKFDRLYGLRTRPVDKRDHYIKRCVGIPGDSIQVINRQLYRNGSPAPNPEHLQFRYKVIAPEGISQQTLDEWGVHFSISESSWDGNQGFLFLDQETVDKIKAISPTITVENFPRPNNTLFPHDKKITNGWTVDNYGPIWIPKKGATVKITPATIAPYRRIISVYEENDLEIKGGKIYINGTETDEYTFQMDYYWMMGDNRHNSEDSRVWGYVPFDHVVGKPLFIWFSTKNGNIRNGINWDRIFTSASKM
jgi:signal peptidase I